MWETASELASRWRGRDGERAGVKGDGSLLGPPHRPRLWRHSGMDKHIDEEE